MEIIDLALTRAQLLSGNNSNGVTLPGQPQGVIAGAGITISTTGIISVNASTVTGLVKLNNPLGYNSYVWPGADGTSGEFLQTDGAGNLGWATPQGFAVVTVQPSPAPVPADIGELWFDCSTGTLNVYQNCVGTPSPNWFNVAQPGLPVEPGNTGATPGFVSGTGTQADPYDCTVTTTGSGSTVQIIQTVTVTSLAPFQYVPIVDLNAVANGGRFSFTNNYADASGNLTFDIVFSDNPPSASGTPYTAAIKVGYGSAYIEARVNVVAALVVTGGSISGPLYVGQQLTYTPGVASGGSTPYGSPSYQWFADGVAIGSATSTTFTLTGAQLGKQITASTTYTDNSSQTATGTSPAVGPVLAAPAALTITSPGSISPATSVVVGNTLNYTAGTFTGGIPTVTPSWKWQRNGTDISGVAANAPSYTTVSADSGQAITVRYQVQDSSTPTPVTQFASTASVTPYAPIPTSTWNPGNGMNTGNPGTGSAAWNGPNGTTITASGCAEVSTDGITYLPSLTVNNGQTLYQRWKQTPACGGAASGTTINGTVSDGTNQNSYSIQINRKPTAFGFTAGSTTAPLSSVQTSNSVTITGINSTAYVTVGSLSAGASTLEANINGGGFVAIPTAPSTSLAITSGQTLQIRFTTGSTASATYTAVVNIGDGDSTQFTASSPGFVVQNTASTVFPGLTFDNGGSPNAAPETLNGLAGGGTLGNLYGFVSSNSWPAGLGTSLSSPASGGNPTMKMRVGAAAYATSGVAVASGQTLNLAWNQAYLDTVTSGNLASGSIQGTVGATTYTNAFSFTVKRTADFTVPTPTPSGSGGAITISQQTPDNYNVPVKLYQTVPGGNALTSVTVSINGATAVALPATIGTALTLNPGDTVAFNATAPAGVATYSTRIHIGDTFKDWQYQVTVTPTVSQPDILNPNDGATGLNPALNSPAGITVDTDIAGQPGGFNTNYSGTQVGADWYVYKALPSNPETSAITNVSTGAATVLATPTGTWYQGPSTYATFLSGAGGYIAGEYFFYSNQPTTISYSGAVPGQVIKLYFAGSGITTSGNISNPQTWSNGTGATSPVPLPNGTILTGSAAQTWLQTPSNFKTELTLTLNAASGSFTLTPDGNPTGYFYIYGRSDYGGSPVTLTLTNATDLADMVVGDAVEESGGTGIVYSDYWTGASRTGDPVDGSGGFSGSAGNAGAAPYVVNGNTSPATWTPPNPIPFTTLRIWGWKNGTFSVNGTACPEIPTNGGGTPGSYTTITSASSPLTSITLVGNGSGTGFSAIEVDGVILTNGNSASGVITAINSGSAPYTLTLSPSSGTWSTTQTAIDISRTVIPPAPPALPPTAPDPTKYQAVTGFNPKAITSGTFNSVLVPQADLSVSSKYYASVIYKGSGSPVVTSQAATWSSFTTASAFVPAPGTAMNGGYFGGQINDGGIIYNLIVGSAASAQYGGATPTGIQWKTSASADTPSALWQNATYGFPASQAGAAVGAGTYPAFAWARNLSISTYNDWYIPAKNELEVLYYFLKPNVASGGGANDTSSGSNPNAVSPEPISTNYTAGSPAQTTAAAFQNGGAEDFSAGAYYWSSTEDSSGTSKAWIQIFGYGYQTSDSKTNSSYSARAIRREYANAPVAIGAAYGGGYFAGQYQDGGVTYNLIVAPVTSGALNGQYGGSTASLVQWKTVSGSDTNPPSQNAVYGGTTTTTFANAQHPLFDWCENNATGPNGGAGIGGFTDWYIPAQNELAILVYNLAPSWTTASLFKASQPQVFDTSNYYWSSTESSSDTLRAWTQWFSNAFEFAPMKDNASGFFARAVRRVVA